MLCVFIVLVLILGNNKRDAVGQRRQRGFLLFLSSPYHPLHLPSLSRSTPCWRACLLLLFSLARLSVSSHCDLACRAALLHSLQSRSLQLLFALRVNAFKVFPTLHVGFRQNVFTDISLIIYPQWARPSPRLVFQQMYFYFPGNTHHRRTLSYFMTC